MDAVQWGDVDYVRDASDMSCFKDGKIEEIYASHILEHFPAKKTQDVLGEWSRILKPGGILHLSVPDFDRAVECYNATGGVFGQFLQDLIHGGQNYDLDVHMRSFTYPLLSAMMSKAGFSRIDRVEWLPYALGDCSTLAATWDGKPISINVKAVK